MEAKNFKAKALIKDKEIDFELDQLRGKKILLYFYPKDLTSGCTIQAKNLTENYEKLLAEGIEVVGVSKDSIEMHKKFACKENIPFYLVSDEDLVVNKLYEVWGEKNMYGKKYFGTKRTSFLIDEDFNIVDVIKRPKTKEHYEEVKARFEGALTS